MTITLEMFDHGAVASVPPWQDPARVAGISIDQETDRDHIREAAIGRVGNNAQVHVLRVHDRAGALILAETYAARGTAWARRAEIENLIDRNRQIQLL
jgi:hypothetical protein